MKDEEKKRLSRLRFENLPRKRDFIFYSRENFRKGMPRDFWDNEKGGSVFSRKKTRGQPLLR